MWKMIELGTEPLESWKGNDLLAAGSLGRERIVCRRHQHQAKGM